MQEKGSSSQSASLLRRIDDEMRENLVERGCTARKQLVSACRTDCVVLDLVTTKRRRLRAAVCLGLS